MAFLSIKLTTVYYCCGLIPPGVYLPCVVRDVSSSTLSTQTAPSVQFISRCPLKKKRCSWGMRCTCLAEPRSPADVALWSDGCTMKAPETGSACERGTSCCRGEPLLLCRHDSWNSPNIRQQEESSSSMTTLVFFYLGKQLAINPDIKTSRSVKNMHKNNKSSRAKPVKTPQTQR